MNVLLLLLLAGRPHIQTTVNVPKVFPNGRSEVINSVYRYGSDKSGARGLLDATGRLYCGPDSFVSRLSHALCRIEQGGPAGHDLIAYLDSASPTTEVVWGDVNEADIYRGEFVRWDDTATGGAPSLGGRTTRPPYVGLAHELAHVMDVWKGTINLNIWKTLPGNDGPQGQWVQIPYAELYATHVENKIRAENGVPLRISYASVTIGEDTGRAYPDAASLIIRPGSRESLYFDCKGHTDYRVLRRTEAPEVY